MAWRKNDPNLTNNPQYLEPRINELAVDLADIAKNLSLYDSLKVAVAEGFDYAPALTKAIQDLPANGGAILIPNRVFGLYSNVTINKTITLIGQGYSSVIRGTGGLITDNDQSHKLIVKNLKLVGTGANTLLSINKAWTSVSSPLFEIQNVWFHSESGQGILLDVYGARESGISNCWFSSDVKDYLSETIGILFRADANGGAMNIHVSNCQFHDIKRGIEGRGTQGYFHLLAGIRMVNNMMIGMQEGLRFEYADYIIFEQAMLDFVNKPVYLNQVINTKIRNSYFAARGDLNNAIEVKMSVVGEEMHWLDISHNRIFSYAATKGHGIVVDGNGGDITYGNISNNDFDLVDRCINLKGSNGGRAMNMQIKDNQARSAGTFIYIESGAENNDIEGNYAEANVTNFVVDNNVGGVNKYSRGNRHGGKRSNNKGKLIASGTGGRLFTAPHYLLKTCSNAIASHGDTSTANLPFAVYYDDTTLYFEFVTAPPAGTNNIVLNWEAEI